jgi:hypothetical protein
MHGPPTGNYEGSVVQKLPPPLLGFNNNVRHRGKVFHIQTEDSGIKHARLTTHLFADGGRIVESTRTDYSEHLGRDDMNTVLRQMMKEQHKMMFVRLRAGELDTRIEAACGPLPLPPPDNTEPPPSLVMDSRRSAELTSDPGLGSDRGPASAPNASASGAQPSAPAEVRVTGASSATASSDRASEATTSPVASRGGNSLGPGAAAASLTLRSPAPASPASLPASASARREATSPPNSAAPAKRDGDRQSNAGNRPTLPGEDARYAQPRPASIFGEVPRKSSLFGEPSVSEQSLDEVILSYLAEDEGPEEN